ncbi:Phosphonopyruvate hydrolase complex with Phosphonopyruvate and Mg++ [Emericellopsis atlantica]|uniref:Phosphonopyruvate hydrolase complex with Phosphonopyruvate and Mg n=1 Tax=Emericellopsis atlantica TaxID=2614577 RepID=A0A9P7ZHS8_9HYPO|nr:Phosphonopyruvate hydrolase complex with Phosphonopyruvate and Mg++ [Emericellopsis atlantica]KAG9252364.1 Phosphonopyruvate hydrolase complex with Phosphonopyruvate and Mg++ [Emericellopsis atlantica]
MSSNSTQNRADRLRGLLNPCEPAIAMSSHNALSAKLVEEAGFAAVWVSGFEISAANAVPDASILPMSVNLEVTRTMSAATNLPLIVDIDTGFGNAVNVAYSVPQFELAGATAVVLEDKVFPKDTSLRANGRHSLVPIQEFQGKISAAKSTSSLVIIARTEALIAGLGQQEALRRAEAYADAGADAILVHSKQKTPEEIVSFCKAWDGRVPLVIVPTNYPSLGFDEVAALSKVGLVICGNHGIRAAVGGMRSVFASIRHKRGLHSVEATIPSVEQIFALQGDKEMRLIEKNYVR